MHKRDYKNGFRRILCIRADNMGDIIMSGPAIRSLKSRFNSHITLLTSSMGMPITPFIGEIDEVIVRDLPWVKLPDGRKTGPGKPDLDLNGLAEQLREYRFDAAVIFTTFSQNPLPAAMLLYMAGIPRRLAYSRENPYELLTDWIPDPEPFSPINHQVTRDLHLVRHWTEECAGDDLRLSIGDNQRTRMFQKIMGLGVIPEAGWIVLHPGVSDARRKYPPDDWIEVSRLLTEEQDLQVILSGSGSDRDLTRLISAKGGRHCYDAAGQLSVGEWIALIREALLLISVNTAAAHIAAAVGTPIVVLYAMTNPQHTPWKVRSIVLPFSVREDRKSKNRVTGYANRNWDRETVPYPDPLRVAEAAGKLLSVYVRKP